MSQTHVERSIDHELDMEYDGQLATLTEKQEDHVQMQEMFRRTVKPGVLELPVSEVVSAENSEKWAIDIEHPVLDDIRVHLDKPIYGWSDDYKIVRVCRWYDIDNQDPHQLQFKDVCIKYAPDEAYNPSGWMLVEPPDYDGSLIRRLRRKRHELGGQIETSYPNVVMYVGLFCASIVTGLSGMLLGLMGVGLGALLFLAVTVLVAVSVDPPGGDV